MTVLEERASFSTLPREFYLDDERLFEAELRRGSGTATGLYLAHAAEIPEPGDYVLRDMLGESVVVVRTASGAFPPDLVRRRGRRIRSRRYRTGPLSARHEPYIRSSLSTYLATMAGDEVVTELLGS